MHRANPTWGAPRIHGELLKLSFTLAQSTVSKDLPRNRRPPSPSWPTFLRNHLRDAVAIDFVVASLERRRLPRAAPNIRRAYPLAKSREFEPDRPVPQPSGAQPSVFSSQATRSVLPPLQTDRVSGSRLLR